MTRPFPRHLLPEFDAASLEELASLVAVVDPAGEILWVNGAWQRSARANGVRTDQAEGRGSYFDGITPELREVYQAAFAKALATKEVFDQIYDCSSPDRRRIFHCRALPVRTDALIVEHALVIDAEPDLAADASLAAQYLNHDGTLLQCSHCRRVRGPEPHAWSWMSSWAAHPHPRTSHVVCPLCADYYWSYAPRRREPR
jgi:hypothetical protein